MEVEVYFDDRATLEAQIQEMFLGATYDTRPSANKSFVDIGPSGCFFLGAMSNVARTDAIVSQICKNCGHGFKKMSRHRNLKKKINTQ